MQSLGSTQELTSVKCAWSGIEIMCVPNTNWRNTHRPRPRSSPRPARAWRRRDKQPWLGAGRRCAGSVIASSSENCVSMGCGQHRRHRWWHVPLAWSSWGCCWAKLPRSASSWVDSFRRVPRSKRVTRFRFSNKFTTEIERKMGWVEWASQVETKKYVIILKFMFFAPPFL